MTKHVMLILIGSREEAVEKVQKVLTAWGCYIRTRLGLHGDVDDKCSHRGLLFLELDGEEDKLNEFVHKLNLIKSVDARLLELKVD
ncbi:MAG: hypothetical protein WCR58_11685 [Bacteroidales bacterium]|nr:hypothetical protein [Bacteroidales bacterium]MCK9447694.1 hypothetical protein [Bacteroidales bacterium]MDD3700199.1 hypothetical protein [Bacteroidales bacterium]MDY0370083.1 hypothetical protein [Bacteroidales bacterium]